MWQHDGGTYCVPARGIPAGFRPMEWREPHGALLMCHRILILFYLLYCQNITCSGDTQLREVWEEKMVVHVGVQSETGLPVHHADNVESLLNVSLVSLFLHTLNLDLAKIKPAA